MKSIKTPVILAVIAVISVILFIPFLGYVDLFDWDEANFAEAAREMIVTGDYLTVQIDFEPFWEKPPLFIWLQAVSMNVFGVNEFAARFPNAVCGVVTLWALFLAGRKIAGNRPGILWAFVYAASILPQFYFRSGIIDPWFNLFIFLGVYFIAGASNTEFPKWWHFTLAGTFIGLAVMTKGPAGLLIFGLVYLVWLIIGRFRKLPSFRNLLLLLSSVICVGSIWFIAEIISGRFEIIMGFFDYHIRLLSTQDAGHGGPFYYHFVVVLLGCFPASFFIFPNLRSHLKDKGAAGSFGLWMILLLAVVLVLFSLVKTKIIHYSSLAYFPVTF
ncbi:MAG: glycosyltransferase family 39 protein, partial [Bacteroidales bacterium]|nr:glycosyltransferase family 39 protein [Bacteroidales bacterium]